MNLSELQLKTQVRTPWQALDTGILLARRWYFPLLLAWMLPAFSLYLLLGVSFYDSPWLAMLLVWWCKPLLDRLPLMLLSRYLFNERPKGVFGVRSLARLYLFDCLSALIWRRTDMRRSFNLAVNVLERQKGRQRARRCAALAPGSGKAATWLTLVSVHLEMLLPLSVVMTLLALFGGLVDLDPMPLLTDENGIYAHLSNLSLLAGMSLVAPFYIASGFALYLNRRVELEAWDLELLFRESARKRSETEAAKGISGVMGMVLAAVLGVALLSPPASSPVNAAEVQSAESEQARDEIRTILESPPFVIEKEVTRWEWKSEDTQENPTAENWGWLERLLSWIDRWNLGWLFKLVEVLIWVGAGLLIWLVVRAVLKNPPSLAFARERDKKQAAGPQVIMGMPISAESLPEDIDSAVLKAFEQGNARLAVSLIYRHVLNLLVDIHRLPVESWYTELECAEAVKSHQGPSITAPFDELTRIWLQLAYAHRQPDREKVQSLHRTLREVLAV